MHRPTCCPTLAAGVPQYEVECADPVHGNDDLPWVTCTHLVFVCNRFFDLFRNLLGDGTCDQSSNDVTNDCGSDSTSKTCSIDMPDDPAAAPRRAERTFLQNNSRSNSQSFSKTAVALPDNGSRGTGGLR